MPPHKNEDMRKALGITGYLMIIAGTFILGQIWITAHTETPAHAQMVSMVNKVCFNDRMINSFLNDTTGNSTDSTSIVSAWYVTKVKRGIVAMIPTDNSSIANGAGYITASSSSALTNKTGNISMWTNNTGYLTAITSTNVISALGYTPSVAYTPTMSVVTRPINSTTWTISTTKQATANYYISITCTATISGPATGTVELQYSTNAGSTWTAIGQAKSSNTVSLAVVLNSVVTQVTPISVSGIPANALLRMVSTSSGTVSISYVYGTETY